MPRIDVPFVVENQQITQPTSEKLVSGGQNYFYATFEIKGVWEKISNIKAVFVRDAISKLVDLVETDKGYECQIPWEVMGYKGAFQVGVFGGDRMLTDYTYVIVKQGCVVEGEVPAPPSPDWFSEIEKYVAGLTDGASAYEIALENGFEGTEQEWLDSLHGYTPQKGTDYWTEEDKAEIKEDISNVGESIDNNAEIFNDYENNETNIPFAHLEGRNNKAVVKCFLIQSYTATSVTLDSVEGIEVGMVWNIFIPDETAVYDKYRGEVSSISGNTVTIRSDAGLANITPSTKGTFLNTFIVHGGTIGTTMIDDDLLAFSVHVEGENGTGFLNTHVEGTGCKALGFSSRASGYYNEALGERSVAMGYRTTARGHESFSIGMRTKASGQASFAEGSSTEASGQLSHAGGYNAKASGDWSFAFGDTVKASGPVSTAFGRETEANGDSSMSIGMRTKASGQASFASGDNCQASGKGAVATGIQTKALDYSAFAGGHTSEARKPMSFAHGYTAIAGSSVQFVHGKFNLIDTEGKYLHIVGNGTGNGLDINCRRNAYTLDWNGNGWFAGNVEATAIVLRSSTGGSTKKFKITVDDSGALNTTEI